MSHIWNDENDTEGGLTEPSPAPSKPEGVRRYYLDSTRVEMVEIAHGAYVGSADYDAKCAEVETAREAYQAKCHWFDDVERQRDALRAEVERLKEQAAIARDQWKLFEKLADDRAAQLAEAQRAKQICAWRMPLWDAINEYTKTCRGDPSKYVYGNTARMDAVAKVERVVSAALTGREGT